MKIRLANKIIKTWTDATDSRYFDSEYDIKESKALTDSPRFTEERQSERTRRGINSEGKRFHRGKIQISKSCERCINFKGNLSESVVSLMRRRKATRCGGEALQKERIVEMKKRTKAGFKEFVFDVVARFNLHPCI